MDDFETIKLLNKVKRQYQDHVKKLSKSKPKKTTRNPTPRWKILEELAKLFRFGQNQGGENK